MRFVLAQCLAQERCACPGRRSVSCKTASKSLSRQWRACAASACLIQESSRTALRAAMLDQMEHRPPTRVVATHTNNRRNRSSIGYFRKHGHADTFCPCLTWQRLRCSYGAVVASVCSGARTQPLQQGFSTRLNRVIALVGGLSLSLGSASVLRANHSARGENSSG